MKNTLFALTNWMGCNPRRGLIVVRIMILVLILALTGGAIDVALAGPITSGS